MFNQKYLGNLNSKHIQYFFSFILYIILKHINTKAYLKLFFITEVKW